MIATLLTQVNSRRIHIFHIPAEMSAFIQLIERHIQSRSHQPQSILILFTPAPHMLNWVPMLTRWHPGLMTSQIHPYLNPVRVLWRHLQATTNLSLLLAFTSRIPGITVIWDSLAYIRFHFLPMVGYHRKPSSSMGHSILTWIPGQNCIYSCKRPRHHQVLFWQDISSIVYF